MERFDGRAGDCRVDDVGSGSVLAFGHGLSCDRHLFDAQVRDLSLRRRCIVFD